MDMKENKLYCKKCHKEMPIDKKKSNKNWTVYDVKCPCGGECDLKRMIEDNKPKKK